MVKLTEQEEENLNTPKPTDTDQVTQVGLIFFRRKGKNQINRYTQIIKRSVKMFITATKSRHGINKSLSSGL